MQECEAEHCRNPGLDFRCNYCDGAFCSDHRLPEKHSCPALKVANAGWTTTQQQATQTQPTLGEQKRNTKTCAECSTHVPPDKDLCRSCRAQQQVSESLSSPDVRTDGSVDYGSDEPQQIESPSSSSKSLRSWLPSPSLRSVWIRIIGWARTVLRGGSIALFIGGVWAIYRSWTISGILSPSLFGYDVPAVGGLSALETMFWGGFLAMMLGLGLAYRWIVSDASIRSRY